MKRIKFPDTFQIMIGFMVLMAMLTWVVPAGNYTREKRENRNVVVPGTYHEVQSEPQGFGALAQAPLKGFVSAAEIIGFVLLVGGAFSVLNKTGAINAGIEKVVHWNRTVKHAELMTIPLFMILFSLGGAIFGMSEEVIPFILIFVPLAIHLGYDSIVGVAIPFVGAGAGFAGAFMNPFTVGIAQAISGLPPSSGFSYRILCWFVITALAIVFVSVYAFRVKRNPNISPVYEMDKTRKSMAIPDEPSRLSTSHKLALLSFLSALLLLVAGVKYWDWYIIEIGATFMVAGMLAGFICRLSAQQITDAFIEGGKDLLSTALIIALAKGILIVAQDGKIIDTILFHASHLIKMMHPVVSSQIMFALQTSINFFLPSGSGQAALTMPVMAPLSDLIGVSRQTAVLAFQFGDGFSNLIIPTSPVCMGVLTMAGIPWQKWAKWMIPLQVLFLMLGLLLLIPPYFFWT